MSTPTTLYRFYDEHGDLLYIGIAGNPGRRFEQHRGDKVWWGLVARTEMAHYPTRESALEAEALAIKAEGPKHNQVHNRRPALQQEEQVRLWRTRSLRHDCERVVQLWLSPVPMNAAAMDALIDAGAPRSEVLQAYVKMIVERFPRCWADDEVPVLWMVGDMLEAAPCQNRHPTLNHDLLDRWTWPEDEDGVKVDWWELEVRYHGLAKMLSEVGWAPKAMDESLPLRSIAGFTRW